MRRRIRCWPQRWRAVRSRAVRGRAEQHVGLGVIAFGLGVLLGVPLLRAAPVFAAEQSYRTSSAARALGRVLTAERQTASFSLHMRAGTTLPDSAVAWLEGTLLKVRTQLSLPQAGKIEAFVYGSSDELADLSGASGWAVFRDGALHLVADALRQSGSVAVEARLIAALSRALEADWARDGGVLGPPEPGRWYRLRVVSAQGKLTLSLGGEKVAEAACPSTAGRVGVAVGRGSVSVRKLRVREGEEAAWAEPLRRVGGYAADVPGAWRLENGVLEGTSLGRVSRAFFRTPTFTRVELEIDLRVSAGATAELILHAEGGAATRLAFSPAGVALHTGAFQRRKTVWLGGPVEALRDAFGAALGALTAGEDAVEGVHAAARTLLDGGRLGGSVVPTKEGRRRASPGLRSLALFALTKDGAATFRQHYFQHSGAGAGPAWLRGRESAWRTFLKDRRFSDRVLQAERRRWGFDILNGSFDRLDLRTASATNKRAGGVKLGTGGGRWERMRTGLRWRGPAWLDPKLKGRAYLRPNVRFGERFCLRVQLALGGTSRVRAMLSTKSRKRSSIEVSTSGAAFFGPAGDVIKRVRHPLRGGRYLDVAFVFEAGGARVYVNGELVAEVEDGLATGSGVAGLLTEGRDVRIREISYRKLD